MLDSDEKIIGMEVTNNHEGNSMIMRAVIVAITNKGRILLRMVSGNEWEDVTPEKY